MLCSYLPEGGSDPRRSGSIVRGSTGIYGRRDLVPDANDLVAGRSGNPSSMKVELHVMNGIEVIDILELLNVHVQHSPLAKMIRNSVRPLKGNQLACWTKGNGKSAALAIFL